MHQVQLESADSKSGSVAYYYIDVNCHTVVNSLAKLIRSRSQSVGEINGPHLSILLQKLHVNVLNKNLCLFQEKCFQLSLCLSVCPRYKVKIELRKNRLDRDRCNEKFNVNSSTNCLVHSTSPYVGESQTVHIFTIFIIVQKKYRVTESVYETTKKPNQKITNYEKSVGEISKIGARNLTKLLERCFSKR